MNNGDRIVRDLFSTDAVRSAHHILPEYVTEFMNCSAKLRPVPAPRRILFARSTSVKLQRPIPNVIENDRAG
jgi:hypothetical protein